MKKLFLFLAAGFFAFAAISCAFQMEPSASTTAQSTEESDEQSGEQQNAPAQDNGASGVTGDETEDNAIDDEVDQSLLPKDWTFIVYMAADNNLESSAIADFNELENTDFAAHNMNMLVLFDRADGYDATNGNWTDTRLFNVCCDAEKTNAIVSERISCPALGLSAGEATELDMANPATLSNLIAFAGKAYPAEHYGLILWGHGTGWRNQDSAAGETDENFRAVAIDDYAGTYMTISSLRTGIERGLSQVDGVNQFDFIGFDTCFGICMETAYELRACSEFLAGTPALVPESGWNYDALFSSFVDGEKSVSALCESALAQYKAQYSYYGYASFSVVECAKVGGAVQAFDEFARSCAEKITDAESRNVYRTIFQSQAESYFATSYKCDFYADVFSLASCVKAADASLSAPCEKLCSALKNAVSCSWTARSDASECPLGVFYAVFIADGVPEVPHSSAYISGSRVSNQSQFVLDCAGYVPSASCSGSLLDRLFYTQF